jgi:hypothetical protein
MNNAIAAIQAAHATTAAMVVTMNEVISRARLEQDQAKNVNVRAMKVTAAAVKRCMMSARSC